MGSARTHDFSNEEIRLAELFEGPLSRYSATRQLAQWRDDPEFGVGIEARASEFRLTLRDLEVLHLLSQGLLASSIGAHLAISPRTGHRHLSNIYAKLGTNDRLSTVMLAAPKRVVPAILP